MKLTLQLLLVTVILSALVALFFSELAYIRLLDVRYVASGFVHDALENMPDTQWSKSEELKALPSALLRHVTTYWFGHSAKIIYARYAFGAAIAAALASLWLVVKLRFDKEKNGQPSHRTEGSRADAQHPAAGER